MYIYNKTITLAVLAGLLEITRQSVKTYLRSCRSDCLFVHDTDVHLFLLQLFVSLVQTFSLKSLSSFYNA